MTEKECARCGACCQVLPLATDHMPPDYKKYLLQRGLQEDKEQGFILIPHRCQWVRESYPSPFEKDLSFIERTTPTYACMIHESPDRSEACRKFHGQKRIGPWRMYVPPGCIFAKKD